MLFVGRIIIPVNKFEIFGNFDFHFAAGIIVIAAGKPEKHIRPHTTFKTVFFCDFKHFVQVRKHNFAAAFFAVKVFVFPESQHMGFVHSDVYRATFKALFKRREHVVYKFVRPVVFREQNIVAVVYFPIRFPAENFR